MRQHEQQTDQAAVVRSEPVPVPPHDGTPGRLTDRAERTGVPEDALDDRGSFDDPTVAEHRADRHGEFHEPGPVPTTFGAGTVGGAVAASALASPRPEDEPDPRLERTARPGDGVADGHRGGDDRRADPTALLHGHHREQTIDEAEEQDRPGRHHHDHATGVAAVDHGDSGVRRDTATDGTGYGSPAPAMVDPDTAPVTEDAHAGPGDPLTAAGTTGSSPATLAGAATLFDAGTAQGFRDRWRDVQLRFVDDPKAAAGQAQRLVEEAIQALAAALAAQKNTIGGWQDSGSVDTEQLRQAVRQYRDFLDRVLGR